MSKSNKEKLRGFYADFVSYLIVNAVLFLVWALFDGGPYWPIWVIIIWGAILLVQAANVGFVPQAGLTIPFLKLFPVLKNIFPFLSENWKEEDFAETSRKVAENLEKVGLETAKTASAAATSVAKAAAKASTSTAKKTTTKAKSTAKKTTAKAKTAVKKTTKTAKKATTKTKSTAKKTATKAASKTKTAAKKTASKVKKAAPKAKKASK